MSESTVTIGYESDKPDDIVSFRLRGHINMMKLQDGEYTYVGTEDFRNFIVVPSCMIKYICVESDV